MTDIRDSDQDSYKNNGCRKVAFTPRTFQQFSQNKEKGIVDSRLAEINALDRELNIAIVNKAKEEEILKLVNKLNGLGAKVVKPICLEGSYTDTQGRQIKLPKTAWINFQTNLSTQLNSLWLNETEKTVDNSPINGSEEAVQEEVSQQPVNKPASNLFRLLQSENNEEKQEQPVNLEETTIENSSDDLEVSEKPQLEEEPQKEEKEVYIPDYTYDEYHNEIKSFEEMTEEELKNVDVLLNSKFISYVMFTKQKSEFEILNEINSVIKLQAGDDNEKVTGFRNQIQLEKIETLTEIPSDYYLHSKYSEEFFRNNPKYNEMFESLKQENKRRDDLRLQRLAEEEKLIKTHKEAENGRQLLEIIGIKPDEIKDMSDEIVIEIIGNIKENAPDTYDEKVIEFKEKKFDLAISRASSVEEKIALEKNKRYVLEQLHNNALEAKRIREISKNFLIDNKYIDQNGMRDLTRSEIKNTMKRLLTDPKVEQEYREYLLSYEKTEDENKKILKLN